MPEDRTAGSTRQRSRADAAATGFDPDLARFFLALGMTGEPASAATLAGLEPERANAVLAEFERPAWLTPRAATARRLFETGTEALNKLRERVGVHDGSADGDDLSLRDLLSVVERCFATAFRLDDQVAGAD